VVVETDRKRKRSKKKKKKKKTTKRATTTRAVKCSHPHCHMDIFHVIEEKDDWLPGSGVVGGVDFNNKWKHNNAAEKTFFDMKLQQAREHWGSCHPGDRLPHALRLMRLPGLKAFIEESVREGDEPVSDDEEPAHVRHKRQLVNARQKFHRSTKNNHFYTALKQQAWPQDQYIEKVKELIATDRIILKDEDETDDEDE
jgi:hypothetical protein